MLGRKYSLPHHMLTILIVCIRNRALRQQSLPLQNVLICVSLGIMFTLISLPGQLKMFVLYKKQGLCPALPGLANLMLDIIYGYMHNLNILCIGKLLHISYINSLTKFKSSSLKNSLSYNSKLIIFTQQTAKQTLIINNTLSLYFTLKGNLGKLCLYISRYSKPTCFTQV